jgi:hypothetical protein
MSNPSTATFFMICVKFINITGIFCDLRQIQLGGGTPPLLIGVGVYFNYFVNMVWHNVKFININILEMVNLFPKTADITAF